MKCPFPIPLCIVVVGVAALGFLLVSGSKKRAS